MVHRSSEGRLRGDDGTALVESAMLLPLLILFLGGIFDFGVGYRNRVIVQNALRSGARVAAASQNAGNADQLTLSTIAAGIGDTKNVKINRVVIYETNGNNVMAAACLSTATDGTTGAPTANGAGDSGTADQFCNIYSEYQVKNAAALSKFTAAAASTCATTNYDRFWCPRDRKYSLTLSGSGGTGPDYLGIYISFDYTTYTGLIKKTVTMTDYVVTRLEPPAGG